MSTEFPDQKSWGQLSREERDRRTAEGHAQMVKFCKERNAKWVPPSPEEQEEQERRYDAWIEARGGWEVQNRNAAEVVRQQGESKKNEPKKR